MNQPVHWRLGLDLGVSSLGWAVIQVDKRNRPRALLNAGVRIFEAGVEGDVEQGKDSSRAAARRLARLPRRQHWRRRRRRAKVFRLLQRLNLLPSGTDGDSAGRKEIIDQLDAELLPRWAAEGDHRAHQLLPYTLRAEALEQPLQPFELGRALFHLAQRRGYLSNRKGEDNADEQGKVLTAISEQEAEFNGRTLGQYLRESVDPHQQRIRRRYTSRKWLLEEFDRIRDAQATHHPDLCDDDWDQIRQAIFFQRPLKSQKNLIGRCSLLPDHSRCIAALPIFQEFRILHAVNDLRIALPDGSDAPLEDGQRQKLIEALQSVDKLTFAKARSIVGLPRTARFTREEWEKHLIGHRTNARLAEVFGPWWFDQSADDREQIVTEIAYYRHPDALVRRAQESWGLDAESAAKLAGLRLEDDYASHSREALRQLVPAMRNGTPYSTARRQLFPESFTASERQELLPPVIEWSRQAKQDINNPAVIRALTELRKVVNALIRRYGADYLETVHIELSRDMKNSRDRRRRIWQNNQDNRSRREKAVAGILREMRIENPSRRDVDKWLLAEECGWKCPFTGKDISPSNLFGSHPQFDIEHIFPRRFLDDSFSNRTLCDVSFNRDVKRDRLPAQAVSGEQFEQMIARVSNFSGPHAREKLRRFQATEVPEDFTTRHLNDNRYNTTLAAEYVGTLFGGQVDENGRKRLIRPTGRMTWMLRRGFGLEGLVAETGGQAKDRSDHRHHAVDAIVVALSDQKRIQALQEVVGESARSDIRRALNALKPPWAGLAGEAVAALDEMIVSHRPTRTVAGPMHAESNYSKPIELPDGTTEHRIRKELHRLTAKEISSDAIVDPKVRQIVQAKHRELGGGAPSKLFSDPANHPVLPNSNGPDIPIHKVRVRVRERPTSIGKGVRQRYVTSAKGGNFAAVVYAELNAEGNETRWFHEIVTRRQAYESLASKKGNPGQRLFPSPEQGKRLKFVLCRNDFLLVDGPDGNKVLYRIQKMSAGEIQLCEHYRSTVAGSDRTPWNQVRNTDRLRQRRATKVDISPVGELTALGIEIV